MEEKKKCIYCKKVLPLSEFYKNRDRPDGRDVLCKLCRKAVQRKTPTIVSQSDLANVPTQELLDELSRRVALHKTDKQTIKH